MTLKLLWDRCVCRVDEWGAIQPCSYHAPYVKVLGFPVYERRNDP